MDKRNYIGEAISIIDGEIEFTLYHPNGDEEIVGLKTISVTCEICDGSGSVVDPVIDSCGISPDEFGADPEFRDNYFSGRYDVKCSDCNGTGITRQPCRNSNSKADLRHYDDAVNEAELMAHYMKNDW